MSKTLKRDHRLAGEVILKCPVSVTATTLLICALIAVGFLVAIFGQYSRNETLTGWLAPDQGISEIYAQSPGVIKRVHVSEGEHVEANQLVATVTVDTALASGTAVGEAVSDNLQEQRAELERQLEDVDAEYAGEEARMAERLENLRRELSSLEDAMALQQRRIELSSDQVDAMEELVNRGFGANIELQRRREVMLSNQQALAEQRRQYIRLQNDIGDVEAQLEQLPVSRQRALSDARLRLAELDSRSMETATRYEYSLTAPTAGRVIGVFGSQGETTSQNLPLVTVLPDGAKLRAVLVAPSTAIGLLEAGQEVEIRYNAFPYQQYGSAKAVIASVSSTGVSAEDFASPSPSEGVVYRVTADLERETMAVNEEDIPLQPGMSLSGRVILERQSLLSVLTGTVLKNVNG